MLQQDAVEADSESLRNAVLRLSEARQAQYYREAKRRFRDPDTYAALNYLLILGLHHLYLGNYALALIELVILAGSILLFFVNPWLAVLLLISVSVFEVWTLFRAQIIVQNFNNLVGWEIVESMQEPIGAIPTSGR